MISHEEIFLSLTFGAFVCRYISEKRKIVFLKNYSTITHNTTIIIIYKATQKASIKRYRITGITNKSKKEEETENVGSFWFLLPSFEVVSLLLTKLL